MSLWRRLIIVGLLSAPAAFAQPQTSAASAAQETLPVVELHVQDRPPYYLPRVGEEPGGLVVEPLRRALRAAALPYRFETTPALRQLLLIEDGAHKVCGVGWFQNPERLAKGRFSRALYQDQPLGLLVRAAHGWRDAQRMGEALADPGARLLVKTGFSYGAEFGRLLAERRVPPAGATGEVTVLARMLAADRADWTPLAFEEAQWLAERQPGVRALRFSDAPAGNLRYLYCNKAVPTEWLRRLDAALPDISRF